MPQPAHVYRRRRAAALAVAALPVVGLGLLLGGGERRDARTPAAKAAAAPAPEPVELPRGGRRLFPDFRVVASYGAPQDPELGTLGIGTPRQAARRLERRARAYARKTRPVLPALELIATIAAAHPGDDGAYRLHQDAKVIDRYLRAARREKMLLVLDVQPGRADFMSEVRRLERWLREPDVGLALDPEWRMGPGEVPGQVIGTTSAQEVNAVSAWLARLVRKRRLPEKLLLIHQFTDDMIEGKERVAPRRGLAIAFNVDGFGGQSIKKAKYHAFTAATPPGTHDGFKLFFREDTDLMTARQVLALRPPPDVVVYE